MKNKTARILTSVCAAAAALCACPARARAQERERLPLGIEIDAEVHAISGEAGFEIGLEGQQIVSKLEYPLDGWMAEARASYAFPFLERRLSVRGRYARSLSVSGTSKDTDYYPDGGTWIYSECDNDATVREWDAEAAFLQPVGDTLLLGGFAGYGERAYDFEDTNLVMSRPVHHTHAGPVATYDMKFTGIYLGAMGRWAIYRGLSIEGRMALIPFLKASGDALWILRDYPFSQTAEGLGASVSARLSYAFNRYFSVFLGARWTRLDADSKGRESGSVDGETYSDEPWVRNITASYFTADSGCRLNF